MAPQRHPHVDVVFIEVERARSLPAAWKETIARRAHDALRMIGPQNDTAPPKARRGRFNAQARRYPLGCVLLQNTISVVSPEPTYTRVRAEIT